MRYIAELPMKVLSFIGVWCFYCCFTSRYKKNQYPNTSIELIAAISKPPLVNYYDANNISVVGGLKLCCRLLCSLTHSTRGSNDFECLSEYDDDERTGVPADVDIEFAIDKYDSVSRRRSLGW